MADAQAANRRRRRAVNVTMDGELLRRARAMGLNLSQVLEERVRALVANQRRALWLEENRPALEAYNRHVEKDGVFSEKLRSF
jgi:antitoxin CcdA